MQRRSDLSFQHCSIAATESWWRQKQPCLPERVKQNNDRQQSVCHAGKTLCKTECTHSVMGVKEGESLCDCKSISLTGRVCVCVK